MDGHVSTALEQDLALISSVSQSVKPTDISTETDLIVLVTGLPKSENSKITGYKNETDETENKELFFREIWRPKNCRHRPDSSACYPRPSNTIRKKTPKTYSLSGTKFLRRRRY